MHTVVRSFSTLFLIGLMLLGNNLFAEGDEAQKTASTLATQQWLKLVDDGNYDQSWEDASVLLKRTMGKEEWKQVINATRASAGSVTSRTLAQQLPAKDPKGLPVGDYMVMLYNTSFSNKPNTKELLTLSFEDGDWKVITYMIE